MRRYIPEKAPYNFMNDYYGNKASIKLYVRRVFISDDFEELIPRWGSAPWNSDPDTARRQCGFPSPACRGGVGRTFAQGCDVQVLTLLAGNSMACNILSSRQLVHACMHAGQELEPECLLICTADDGSMCARMRVAMVRDA